MLQVGRLAVLMLIPLLFRGGYEIWPKFTSESSLLVLLAVFTAFWSGILFIFSRLFDLAKVEGLTGAERSRLRDAMAILRKRLWLIGGICGGGAIVLLSLILSRDSLDGAFVSWTAGGLVGMAGYYLMLVPFWHEEIQDFVERVLAREERRKELERAVKDLQSTT